MMKPSAPEHQGFYDDLSRLLPATAWQSTVPILAWHQGMLRQHGTGTLFRIADTSFLVTAAHVILIAVQAKAHLAIGQSPHGHPLTPLRAANDRFGDYL